MNEFWALLSQIGLWGWVAAVLFFIHYSFPRENQFIAAAALKWGGLSLGFFLFWVTGMLFA